MTWGRALALTFANCMIWGQRFSSKTGGTRTVPTFAGLFRESNDPQNEALSTEPSTQQTFNKRELLVVDVMMPSLLTLALRS